MASPESHRGYSANGPSRDDMIKRQFENAARNASRSRAADQMMKTDGLLGLRELDQIIDRIDQRMKERAGDYARMEAGQEDFGDAREDIARSVRYTGEEACVNEPESLLGSIERRIEDAARHIEEVGHRLNRHADKVHGPVPTSHNQLTQPLGGADKAYALTQRIFDALDTLTATIVFTDEAAARNTTLA